MILPRIKGESPFSRLPGLLTTEHITPTGIVHVGAHHGEEVPHYRGFDLIRLVEPNPRLAALLRNLPGVEVVEAAVAAEPGEAVLKITKQTSWSSIYGPPPDRATTPEDRRKSRIVEHVTVPVIAFRDVQDGCNVAVLDCQGGEQAILETADLDALDMLIIECSTSPGWQPALPRVAGERWLAARGWRVAQEWGHKVADVTDVVFVRRQA